MIENWVMNGEYFKIKQWLENTYGIGDQNRMIIARSGSPLICIASRYGQKEIMKKLLEYVDVNDCGITNQCAIDEALFWKQDECVKFLLDQNIRWKSEAGVRKSLRLLIEGGFDTSIWQLFFQKVEKSKIMLSKESLQYELNLWFEKIEKQKYDSFFLLERYGELYVHMWEFLLKEVKRVEADSVKKVQIEKVFQYILGVLNEKSEVWEKAIKAQVSVYWLEEIKKKTTIKKINKLKDGMEYAVFCFDLKRALWILDNCIEPIDSKSEGLFLFQSARQGLKMKNKVCVQNIIEIMERKNISVKYLEWLELIANEFSRACSGHEAYNLLQRYLKSKLESELLKKELGVNNE